jgi:hypothetical protein
MTLALLSPPWCSGKYQAAPLARHPIEETGLHIATRREASAVSLIVCTLSIVFVLIGDTMAELLPIRTYPPRDPLVETLRKRT